MAEGKRGAQPGNQNSAKDRRVRRELIAVLDENPERLREMCLQQVAKAMMGDTQAFKEVRDTIDGKPHQSVSHDGDGEGGPMKFSHAVVEFVQAQNGKP